MKAIVTVCFLVGVTCSAMPVCADENYWARIRRLLEEVTPQGDRREAAETYLKSLTAEQLIIAGRDCARQIQDAFDSRRPGADGMMLAALGFFFEYYPQATNGLHDISPILREISDNTQPMVWRRELAETLLDVNDPDEWAVKLTNEQRQQVFDRVGAVLNDRKDSVTLRAKIASLLPGMLSKLYNDYRAAARDAPPSRKAEEEKALEQFTQRVQSYLDNSLKLFSDPATPLRVRQAALGGAMGAYQKGLPGSAPVKSVAVQAFANYKGYPENLWPQLAQYAVENFKVANANDVVDRMVREAADETVRDALQLQQRGCPR